MAESILDPKHVAAELETGIFNMVVTWIHQLKGAGIDDKVAREYVANNLISVSEALKTFETNEKE